MSITTANVFAEPEPPAAPYPYADGTDTDPGDPEETVVAPA